LKAARADEQIKVLVLDSITASPKELISTAISTCVGLENSFVHWLSQLGVRFYLMNSYDPTPACDFAKEMRDKRVLLLSGPGAGHLRETTTTLQSCFDPSVTVETRTDLPLSGFDLPSVTGEQGEAYDRVVIDYFDRNLR
jgi:hypothetical protein